MDRRSFWPIAQRVKERRSLKKDRVIDSDVDDDNDKEFMESDVTEGLPSLPPVHSVVTDFWPIAQRVKERRSLKNDRVIDSSDVTEGIPSLSLLWSSWKRLTTPIPRSRIATPCVGPTVPGTTLGRDSRYVK
jgi:hypothetical protein